VTTSTFQPRPRGNKLYAIMVSCPGLINDGRYHHAMRDFCSSCAPFWESYPTCPVHRTKLTAKLYCTTCRTKYSDPRREPPSA
jgi:hypothetical protein